jgi:hypothetical protein
VHRSSTTHDLFFGLQSYLKLTRLFSMIKARFSAAMAAIGRLGGAVSEQ